MANFFGIISSRLLVLQVINQRTAVLKSGQYNIYITKACVISFFYNPKLMFQAMFCEELMCIWRRKNGF